MTEIKQRIANICRFLSMISVLASLLFLYGYGTDNNQITVGEQGKFWSLPKATLFYSGLIVFGLLNILTSFGIKIYRDSSGQDTRSLLFRSEEQKANVLVWLTFSAAAVNVLLATTMVFIAFIKIDGLDSAFQYAYIPLLGIVLFVAAIVGLLISVFQKSNHNQ